MEKRLRRIEIILVIVGLLTLTNLLKPSISELFHSLTSTSEVTEGQKELPVDLNKEACNKIVYQVKTNFNKSDWSGMYDIFGEYAKAGLSPEKIESEFKKLRPLLGKIVSYAYSHYTFEGEGNEADWFEVEYKCRFENGNGNIKISFRTVDEVSEVTGININLEGL